MTDDDTVTSYSDHRIQPEITIIDDSSKKTLSVSDWEQDVVEVPIDRLDILSTQYPELSILSLDFGKNDICCEYNASEAVVNVAGQSQPPIQQQKRKNVVRLSQTKRLKCDFSYYGKEIIFNKTPSYIF